MRVLALYRILALVTYLFGAVQGQRQVFAHYLVGGITTEHAIQDINDASNMGLDGFALNVGDATLPWVLPVIQSLFAQAKHLVDAGSPFYLYLSLDVYASGAACYAGGNSCNGAYDYAEILKWALSQPAYAKGPNGKPMISTFSSGGFTNTYWKTWKSSLDQDIYFCPDFDETDGYYGGADALDNWFSYWGDVVDCIFSWESAWPSRGSPLPDSSIGAKICRFVLKFQNGLININGLPFTGGASTGDVAPDIILQLGALNHDKEYMMGLSSIQYKNSYGANIFRQGGLTLPARMQNILSNMPFLPDFVIVQTWNDGPEAHNFGNLWPEQNDDEQPSFYMQDHSGWRSLISAFIEAFHYPKGYEDMYLTGTDIAGAMWYRPLPVDAICPFDDGMINGSKPFYFWEKPFGYDSAGDTLNWAVVVTPAAAGSTLVIYSGSDETGLIQLGHTITLHQGLNYGSNSAPRNPGTQLMVITPSSVIGTELVAGGGGCVYDSGGCNEYIYNMNVEVLEFLELAGGSSASDQVCSTITPPDIPIDLLQNQGDGPDPEVMGLPDGYPAGLGISFVDDYPACVNENIGELSEACYDALSGNTGYFFLDHSCHGPQTFFTYDAIKYAYRILGVQRGTPIWPSTDAMAAAAAYWMGPDYENFLNQITVPVANAHTFHTGFTRTYITVTCNDPKKWCSKVIGGTKRPIGAYAWDQTHWFIRDTYFINLCPPFFTTQDGFSWEKQILGEVARGDTSKAADLSWLQTSGSYLIHEMMHTGLISGYPLHPPIIDEPIDPGESGTVARAAYMPKGVRLLARRNNDPANGGGARRAATNADSYTQMMNAVYWQQLTGITPLYVAKGGTTTDDPDGDTGSTVADNLPISMYLGNITNLDDASLTSIVDSLSYDFYAP